MDDSLKKAIIRLTGALDDLETGYALIGGIAVGLVSKPRTTLDVDAMIWAPLYDVDHLLSRFLIFGITPRREDTRNLALAHRVLLLQSEDGVPIDVSLGALPFEDEAIRSAREIPLEGNLSVKVASPESLIVMKALANRPKDREDIRQLLLINTDVSRSALIETAIQFSELIDSHDPVEVIRQAFRDVPEAP